MPGNATATYGFPPSAFDPSMIPDFDNEFLGKDDLEQFAKVLDTPEYVPVVALNDWRPVHQRVKRRSRRKVRKTADETREGFVHSILRWPLLMVVLGWIIFLGLSYCLTRTYIWAYERLITWRGRRQSLRSNLRSKTTYEAWTAAAQKLDEHLGNEEWKETDDYAYYDFKTVMRVKEQLKANRSLAKSLEDRRESRHSEALDKLRTLVEGCVKNNFAGLENPQLYSNTYYGTKQLLQDFLEELLASIKYLLKSPLLSQDEKYALAKRMHTNFGRTALCLSGGASFAYYHFGVVKALLDASVLPDCITGTSGGALVAALVATRTNEELQKLLVPALAHRIRACEDSFLTWAPRWWRTGARFDSLDWARHCSWFTRGLTFREAYERTGRILNVSCVPSDPHSPTILVNYLTNPDCIIWSAVLASAAVPGILNPVVMMMKSPSGALVPYSFGHKWKDGSLRTDIPLKALNLYFQVNFSVVSQVNPHINLFFFSPKGTVGRPVTHRKGRGWRGGFLGSATTTWLVLEMRNLISVAKQLEILPRPLGQDWSSIWLQQFQGKITIWPKVLISDFWNILTDPTPKRLARMLLAGQQSTFPKILFIQNRMKIERVIEEGLLRGVPNSLSHTGDPVRGRDSMHLQGQLLRKSAELSTDDDDDDERPQFLQKEDRRSSVLQEFKRQSEVFFDDHDIDESDGQETAATEGEHEEEQ